MVADPRDPSGLYAALPNVGIYHSVDGGLHWTEYDTGVTGLIGSDNIKLAATTNPSSTVVYAAVDQLGSALWRILHLHVRRRLVAHGPSRHQQRTSHGTPTFFGIHPGKQGNIHLSLAADPANPTIVYIGGDRQPGSGKTEPVFPNASGANDFSGRHFIGIGGSWSAIEDNGANGTAPHADSRAMVFDALGNLLEADDGGIYRLSNPGSSSRKWTSVIGNLAVDRIRVHGLRPAQQHHFRRRRIRGLPSR